MKTHLIKAPPPSLAPYADFLFVCGSDADPSVQEGCQLKDIPNGNARIFFLDQGPDLDSTGKSRRPRFKLGVQGPRRILQSVPVPAVEYTGISVKPGALKALTGIPTELFADRIPSLEEVWGGEGRLLYDEMMQASGPVQRLALLESALIRKVERRKSGDSFVLQAASLIQSQGGKGTLDWFFDRMGYSQQYVTRKFKEGLGMGPKEYARIIRFRRLFQGVPLSPQQDWSALSPQFGFFDQSHLIRNFHKLTGQSPVRFMEEFEDRGMLIPGQASRELIMYLKK